MRPLRYGAEDGSGNQMEKRSMDLEHAKDAWDEWEIHCLILLSLSLQVVLSLKADLRRRSASHVLSTLLWLAYMSADTVAIFVLGHLAVHAQRPSHELMLFWAPFVLVHLGGQDTMTAFSKQDNELWTRHLLGLVTQTAVAAYVVSRSSWPDARLRAAMVIMFICGFFKYAGRTICLFNASPTSLKAASTRSLSRRLRSQKKEPEDADRLSYAVTDHHFETTIHMMFHADYCWELVKEINLGSAVNDIMLMDSPVDDVRITMVADELPKMREEDMTDRCIAYQYVAACLVQSYLFLYTKTSLSMLITSLVAGSVKHKGGLFECLTIILMNLTYILFHCISTVTALVLFASAQKEGHYSKPDITVSYILLVGAIVLDLLPSFTSILSFVRKPFHPRTVAQCVRMSFSSCFHHRGWLSRKQWSEELAQYSMTMRYSTTVNHCDYRGCMTSIQNWVISCKPIGLLGPFMPKPVAWCAKFYDLARTTVTEDLKLFVLDRLLLLQTRRQEWDFACFRGERATGKWMDINGVPESERSRYELHKSLRKRVDFPASVLIWHIATEILYFSRDKITGTEPDKTKKKMMMSRELSHYIMYLVFKCDVMLTANSRLVHDKAHEELTRCFGQARRDEKETVMVMVEAMKEATKKEEQQQGNKDEEQDNKDASATSSKSTTQELLKSMAEAIYTPVLPRAYALAEELIHIDDEAGCWELISEVWLEMLFYTAPRCGAAFHYEHLSTGGEFITHVLVLMGFLGPFMPKPVA